MNIILKLIIITATINIYILIIEVLVINGYINEKWYSIGLSKCENVGIYNKLLNKDTTDPILMKTSNLLIHISLILTFSIATIIIGYRWLKKYNELTLKFLILFIFLSTYVSHLMFLSIFLSSQTVYEFNNKECYSNAIDYKSQIKWLTYLNNIMVLMLIFNYLKILIQNYMSVYHKGDLRLALLTQNKILFIKREVLISKNKIPPFESLSLSDYVIDDYKNSIFVSHRWLSKEEPDPMNVDHSIIVEKTKNTSYFIDYSCIPQYHPIVKSMVLKNLNKVISSTNMFVIGSNDYLNRGWCFFELAIALYYKVNIQLHRIKIDQSMIDEINLALSQRDELIKIQLINDLFKTKVCTNNDDVLILIDLILKI